MLYDHNGDEKYPDSSVNASFYLKALQNTMETKPENPVIHGAILGMDVAQVAENNDMISLRVTMYAIYTYLLYGLYDEFISKGEKRGISERLIENPMFIGLKLSK